MPVLVEVAVDDLAGARAAVAAGAGRLELCSNLDAGGLTPSRGLVDAVRAAVAVPLVAMLRPRPGDFLYTEDELAVLCRDATRLRDAGLAAFVTGVLTADGCLDEAACRRLQAAAAPVPLVCHRAFDLTADPFAALSALRRLGIGRVLSSGQAASAPAGTALLRELVRAGGGDVVVMPGAGIRPDNAAAVVAGTGCRELHLSATLRRPSGMRFRRAHVAMGSGPAADEAMLRGTDPALVAAVVEVLRPFGAPPA